MPSVFIVDVGLSIRYSAIVFREGINFALSLPVGHTVTAGAGPPYVDFLSVLGEFSNRLLEIDRTGKKGVLVFLQVCSILIMCACHLLSVY